MKLDDTQLLEIIKLSREDNLTSRELGLRFDVTKSTINYFLARKTHTKFWSKFDTGQFGNEHPLDEVIDNTPDDDIRKLSRQLRTSQKTNTMLRRLVRNTCDGKDSLEEILEGIQTATEGLTVPKGLPLSITKNGGSVDATLEVLFSDLQIGKVSRHYNTKIAKISVGEYGESIIKSILDRTHMYNVERIVFAMIGDIVEDHMKHNVQSAISTDTGLAEQMHDAIECVWSGVLQPLADLNIPIDVVCVTGNHGSSQHKGMDSFKAGRFSYDFVIHHTLRRYCELAGYKHITFSIPDGTFGNIDIYGKTAVYEHGYHNPCSEKGMTDQMLKRGQQIGKHVTYWRQGDKHHHTCFGQGSQVLNGAFFGIETEGIEYSGILGFNSVPSQTIMYHVDEKRNGRSNIQEIINIQLGQLG